MEIIEVIRRRSRSRESDKHEGTPRGRHSPIDPDHTVSDDYDDSHSHYDSEYELPEHYEKIQEDQLGKILLNIMKDQFLLAKKCNLKTMNTNMDEMCDSFNEFLQVNEIKREESKKETQHEMEQKMIQKQLNGHLQKQAFRPPAYFSPTPVINNSLSRTSDIYKLFTNRTNKFSGNPKDSLSLLEFLNSMNSAQAQAKLSEPEFKEMLLLCTTGEAHKFLVDWFENSNENVASTYHQLGLRFDNRKDPETARNALFAYVATKDKTLAQIESEVMALAYRACDIYPPGDSRMSNKGKTTRKPYANYGIERSVTPSRAETATAFASSADKQSPPTKDTRRTPRGGHNREKKNPTNPSANSKGSNGGRRNTSNNGSRRPFNKKKGCSLCGQYSHQEPDTCPNMVTDSGTHIRLHPIQGTCSECPGNRKNTLHHPKSLCPWRPAGIFRKTSQ